MSSTSNLASEVRARVAGDGRLLDADDALLRLNQRAGGEPGGTIAIPPLLNLVRLSLKLQMRLSRAVRVADDTANLELWVEAWPGNDVVDLSILSWRELPECPVVENPSEMLDAGISYLRFDLSTRLIRANGTAADGIGRDEFGKPAAVLVPALFGDCAESRKLVRSLEDFAAFPPTLLTRSENDEKTIVSGRPLLDKQGNVAGYDCTLEQLTETERAEPPSPPSTALFGQHLAPVMRQPLGRIIANAETIGQELQGPIRENYAFYARDIANAARHLSALVDDLGDLEAVERPGFTTAPDVIELGDVARRAAGLVALRAANHSIRISTPPVEEQIMAVAEFRRVLQIMLNLITNAVRYSPDETEVSIEIGFESGDAIMSVSDQGAGIDPADREKIFEKFERLDRTGDGGSGLGLYISRKLARAMKGELVVGEAAGGGAKFTLHLPAR